MKTLILNGSPRVDGNTAALINKVTKKLRGEVKVIDAYRCNVSPCVDCRYCWENSGCKIDDEMQEIYQYIQECDNILIASPIYFSELTGKLLDLGSRLQVYFSSRHFRNREMISKSKKGAVVLVGGGDGNAEKANDTALTLLHHMKCDDVYPLVLSHRTNEKAAVDDPRVLGDVSGIVKFFNAGR